MQTQIKKFLLIGCIVLLNVFLWGYLDVYRFFTLKALHFYQQLLASSINTHYWLSLGVYIVLYILDATLFLPITAALIIAGGFLFGIIPTVICSIIGASIGGTFAFLISRYLLGTWFQKKFALKLHDFNQQLSKYGTYYLLFSRTFPIVPFSLVNILAGLTLLPMQTFFWTTAVGIIPNVIIYAYIGKQVAMCYSISDLITPQFLGAITLLILITIITIFTHYKFHQK